MLSEKPFDSSQGTRQREVAGDWPGCRQVETFFAGSGCIQFAQFIAASIPPSRHPFPSPEICLPPCCHLRALIFPVGRFLQEGLALRLRYLVHFVRSTSLRLANLHGFGPAILRTSRQLKRAGLQVGNSSRVLIISIVWFVAYVVQTP